MEAHPKFDHLHVTTVNQEPRTGSDCLRVQMWQPVRRYWWLQSVQNCMREMKAYHQTIETSWC